MLSSLQRVENTNRQTKLPNFSHLLKERWDIFQQSSFSGVALETNLSQGLETVLLFRGSEHRLSWPVTSIIPINGYPRRESFDRDSRKFRAFNTEMTVKWFLCRITRNCRNAMMIRTIPVVTDGLTDCLLIPSSSSFPHLQVGISVLKWPRTLCPRKSTACWQEALGKGLKMERKEASSRCLTSSSRVIPVNFLISLSLRRIPLWWSTAWPK